MHSRRKGKATPLTNDIFVEVMEPRVLLSADALGLDSSVFDRDLQQQDTWDLSVATHWWGGTKQSASGDSTNRDVEHLQLGELLSQSDLEDSQHYWGSQANNLDAMHSINPSDGTQNAYREIVFLDTGVQGGEQLLSDLLRNTDTAATQVYLIDSSTDGVEQISTALNGHRGLDAVHIISHGSAGQVQLGNGTLSSGNVGSYGGQLEDWTQALSESGDILIYGCDLASDTQGQSLVNVISALTGADVAASVDQTSSAKLGGDWELEYRAGAVETAVLSQFDTQAWTDSLALLEVSTFNDLDDGGDSSSVANLKATPGSDGISLREAIMAANGDSSEADTIYLTAGTYTLAIAGTGENSTQTGDLDIATDVTITGDGTSSTFIDGGGIDRVFEISNSSTVAIQDVTIMNGDASSSDGGAMYLEAGAIANLVNVDLRGSHAASGGGIFSAGTLLLTDVTVDGNTGEWGGGINLDGGLATIVQSTISDNSSSNSGGGIYNSAAADASLTNVTISGNQSTTSNGGGLWSKVDMTATNVTIAYNESLSGGSGIHIQGAGDVTLTNTILHNPAGSNANKALTSGGSNIDSDGTAGLAQSGDAVADPLIDSNLDNNGGTTKTHALLTGSTAIDAPGLTGAPSTDQRGITRDGSPDIGAFEFVSNATPVADAGGAYAINEGDDLSVDASASSDADGSIAQYKWDLNNDLNYDDFISNSATPTIDWATLVSWGIDDGDVAGTDYTIGLQVVDNEGSTHETSTTVTMTNVAPTISVTGNTTVYEGFLYTLNLSSDDPGDDSMNWEINWGDGVVDSVAGNVSEATHTYVGEGVTYNITVAAIDEDGTFHDNRMLITDVTGNQVWNYAANAVATSNSFSNNMPTGIGDAIIGPDGMLYVGGFSSGEVKRFDPNTGVQDNSFLATTGVTAVGQMAFGPDGNLYVSSFTNSRILSFDPTDGSANGTFIDGAGDFTNPVGLLFHPNGKIYVGGYGNDSVVQYDSDGSNPVSIATGADGLNGTEFLHAGPDNEIYITSYINDRIYHFDGSTLRLFAESNGLDGAIGVDLGPDGFLYVASEVSDTILRYDTSTFADDGYTPIVPEEYVSTGLGQPRAIEFVPSLQVTVATNAAPIAHAGGTYNISEGDDLVLDGSGSSDSDGSITEYRWDLNNDLDYSDFTAFNANSTVDWATIASLGLDDGDVGGKSYTVGLQVVDDLGSTHEATTTVVVDDVAPTLTTTGNDSVAVGDSYALNLSAVDAGNDTITSWTINWGDGQIETFVGDPASVNHVYANVGFTYNILASAIDEDGTYLQNELIVASGGNDRVVRYDQLGDVQQTFAIGEGLDYPIDVVIGPDGDLFVSGYQSSNVLKFDATTGALIETFVEAGSGGLDNAFGLAFGPDGNLYVASRQTSEVLRFDGTTGDFIDTFVTTASGGLNQPEGMIFGLDGNLYVSDYVNNAVYKYNGDTGAFISIFVSSGSGGLNEAEDLAFGPDGNLYVAADNGHNVLRYNGSTGAYIDEFITAGSNGLANAMGVEFGPDGNFYVSSWGNHNVLRFDGDSGDYIDEYVAAGDGGLTRAVYLNFIPEQQVTITPVDSDGDGLLDNQEDINANGDNDPSTNPGPDTDGDGIANYLDPDDDGDGIATSDEHADANADGDPRDALDSDHDGQPDYLDKTTGASTVTVSNEQKIGNGSGGFTATLDPDDRFARSITSIGDLDGDGIVDLVVGAPNDDDSGNDRGSVYVLFLNSDGTVREQQKISALSGWLSAGLSDNDRFGRSVANIGDIDGDGINDIAVGAVGDDDGGSDRGAVHILMLNSDGTVKAEQKISDNSGGLAAVLNNGDHFGKSVAGIGDLDGDGINDLAVGAALADDGNTDAGAVYILFLNSDGTVKAEQKISSTEGGLNTALNESDLFGASISNIGDIDGDGITDIAIGASDDDTGGIDRGAVYVLQLNTDGTVKAEQKLSDSTGALGAALDDSDFFGYSVAGVGDLNKDGISDIAVGSYNDDDGGDNRGAVHVLLLNSDGTIQSAQKISATAGGLGVALADGDQFGRSVTSLGDLDGDGAIDLAVGASFDDDAGAGRGALYVLGLGGNAAPTLSVFNGVVDSTIEDTEVEIGFTDLATQGDESDTDGTVEAFVVKAIASGSLMIGATAGSATAWVSGTNDRIDDTHNAYWAPDEDANGELNAIDVVAQDDLGEESASPVTATVKVSPQNDEQILATNAGLTVLEGSTDSIISSASLQSTDVDNSAEELMYTVTAVPVHGEIKLSDVALQLNESFSQDDIDNSRVTYDHDGSETSSDGFGFSVDDGAGDASTGTFSMIMTPQNDEQILATNAGLTVLEGSIDSIISSASLQSTDVDNSAEELMYTVTAVPVNGEIKLNDVALQLNESFSQDDIDNSRVTYDHDGSETSSDGFGFSVDDGAGDASAGTFNIAVTAQNNEQVLAVNTGLTVAEGREGSLISSAMLSTTDSDHSASEVFYTLSSTVSNGSLKLSGTALAINDTFTQNDIDIGKLFYDHDGSESRSDSFVFRVDDGVGVSSMGTFNITVTEQNDEQVLERSSGHSVEAGSVGTIIDSAMLNTTDADNTAEQIVYTVTKLPAYGMLKLDSTHLELYDTFTQDDINNARVSYDHDGSSSNSDRFEFSVDDGVGDVSLGSFVITVIPDSAALSIESNREIINTSTVNSFVLSPESESSATSIQSTSEHATPAEEAPDSGSADELSVDQESIDEGSKDTGNELQFATDIQIVKTPDAAASDYVSLMGRLLQTASVPGLLTAPFEFDPLSLEIKQLLVSVEFNETLDHIRNNMDNAKLFHDVVTGSGVAATAGLSVGYVAWMVRGGVLLSTVLTSLPAWQFVDPLPVLNRAGKNDRAGDRDDSLEDIIAEHSSTSAKTLDTENTNAQQESK